MSLKQTARPNLNFLLQGENSVLLLMAGRTRELGPTWGVHLLKTQDVPVCILVLPMCGYDISTQLVG